MDYANYGLHARTVTRKNVDYINETRLPQIPTRDRFLPNNRRKDVIGDILLSTQVVLIVPTPFGNLEQKQLFEWIMSAGEFKRRFEKVRLSAGFYEAIPKSLD